MEGEGFVWVVIYIEREGGGNISFIHSFIHSLLNEAESRHLTCPPKTSLQTSLLCSSALKPQRRPFPSPYTPWLAVPT